ncbi:MAG: hypothetical protein ACFB0G_01500 [Leptolyngbyaceae cyanobacterium]
MSNLVAMKTHLQCCVPLKIMELERAGGPTESDFAQMRSFAQTLAEKGDTLQFGGKRGEAASLMNQLVRALAVLSFATPRSREEVFSWLEFRSELHPYDFGDLFEEAIDA